jgi:DNA-directed RNA polymerase specialized sigma24 family protein
VQLQRFPDGSPLLRGRFHHDFVDLALDEPARERAQVGRAGPDLVAFKVEVALDLDAGHHRPTSSCARRFLRFGTALLSIPEIYRVPLVLMYTEDLSYRELAELLACPVGTIMSRLHRGRKAVEQALWECAQRRGWVKAWTP